MACSRLRIVLRPAELRFAGQRDLELQPDAKLSLKHLLHISLLNPTNLCYLNSTVLAIAWTMLQARLHGLIQQVLVPALSFDQGTHLPCHFLPGTQPLAATYQVAGLGQRPLAA